MDSPGVHLDLDLPSPGGTPVRRGWKPRSLELPSPGASPKSQRSAAALWQKLRSSLAGALEQNPEADHIYSTEGPGSDPTSRCSSPDGYLQRRVLKAQFGSLVLDTSRLVPEREEFLCQQLDEASEEIDRLCVERDDALKKLHDLAKAVRGNERLHEDYNKDFVSVACQHSDDEKSSDDNAVARTKHMPRIATCPVSWSPSPEQETCPEVGTSIFAERRHWHEEFLELESQREDLQQQENRIKAEAQMAWSEMHSAVERRTPRIVLSPSLAAAFPLCAGETCCPPFKA